MHPLTNAIKSALATSKPAGLYLHLATLATKLQYNHRCTFDGHSAYLGPWRLTRHSGDWLLHEDTSRGFRRARVSPLDALLQEFSRTNQNSIDLAA